MFLYDSIIKTDYLLKKLHDLKQFKNINLYIQNNFKELNDIFTNLIKDQIKFDNYAYNQKDSNIQEIKARNINKKIKIDNNKRIKKTPIYFFKNYPLEANY